MTYVSPAEALKQKDRPVRIQFEMQDTDGYWVDLSDRFRQDRLVSMGGGLSARQEREVGAFDVQLATITVKNDDRFWDLAPLLAYPAEFIFASTWKRRRVRITLITLGGAQSVGVWLLEKVTTRANNGQATLTLRTLASLFVDAQADRVRNGKQWWINKPVGFLVKRLLETRMTPAEVEAFPEIQNTYQIPSSTGEFSVSSFSRPPEDPDRIYTISGNPMALNDDAADPEYGMLWFGLEEELWKFDPVVGDWIYWSKLPAGLVAAGYKIHHVYVSTLRDKIAVLAWVPEHPSANTTANLTGTALPAAKSNIALCTASMTAAPATMTELNVGVDNAMFTGLFSIRAGRTVNIPFFGDSVVVGGFDPAFALTDGAGMNMPFTQSHWVRCQDEDVSGTVLNPFPANPLADDERALFNMAEWNGDLSAWDGSARGPNDAYMKSRTTSLAYWQQELAGYMAWVDNATPTYPANYRFNMGQDRGAFAFHEASDLVVLTRITWDGGLARYKAEFVTWNIETGAWTQTGKYVMTGNDYLLPTSMRFDPTGTKLLVTAHRFSETAWSGGSIVDTGTGEPVQAVILEVTWPLVAGGFTGEPGHVVEFDSTSFAAGDASGRRRWIPLDAEYGRTDSSPDYLVFTFLDYSKLYASPWGVVVKQIGAATYGQVHWSTGRCSGLAFNDGTNAMLYHDAGLNQAWEVNAGSTSSQHVVMAQGAPPVDGDAGITAGIFYSDRDLTYYSISGPGTASEHDPDVMNPPQSGKYFLWQLGEFISDRVELADFTDMSVWDAISNLAAIGDFVFGFDEVGDFFFRQRTQPTAAIATIKAQPNVLAGEIAATELTKDWGFDEIFNYAEITPSRVVLSEPTGSVKLLERPAGWVRDVWNGEVVVLQKSLTKHHIILRCVRGGVDGDEDAGCVKQDRNGNVMVMRTPAVGEQRHRLRFAWVIYDRVIETQLLEQVSGSPTVIKVPYLAALDTVRGIDESSALATSLGGAHGDVLEIGTTVRSIRDISHDSVLGVSTITLDAALLPGTYPIGTRVVIRSFQNAGWSNGEEGVTRLTSALTAAGTDGDFKTFSVLSTRHLAVGMIVSIATVNAVASYPFYLITQIVSGTSFIGRRTGTTGTTDASNTNAVVSAYLAPIINDEFPRGTVFWIGGTGIGIQVDVPDPQTLGPIVETPFMVGDEIEITADGLILQQQDMAKQIAANRDSIATFGILEYRPGRRSPFLDYTRARATARRIVESYAFPHFMITADLPLTVLPKLDQCYLVEDSRILPYDAAGNAQGDNPAVAPDTARAIAFVVRGFNVDPVTGRAQLTLRAVHPHDY